MKHVVGPTEHPLEMACTPTGVELCFNATDDNCNGVIDEGCGLSTGFLQFSIAWGESLADVDLVVTLPNGEVVSEASKKSDEGFRLDRDCPGEDNACRGQNVENIFYEGKDPPRGRYKVEIKRGAKGRGHEPVSVRFGLRVQHHTFGANVELGMGMESKSYVFDL